MVVDRFMRTVIQGRRHGIQWTVMTVLEDPASVDDIGLPSNKQMDAQQKAERLSKTASSIGLNVNTKKKNENENENV